MANSITLVLSALENRKEMPNYKMKPAAGKKSRKHPTQLSTENSMLASHPNTVHASRRDTLEQRDGQSPALPMNLVGTSPVGATNVQAEGQVMHHFNSDTPAEKAKKRASLAERMIGPESTQVRASPAKAKNKDPRDLLRLSNDVLNMTGQPASAARRMTLGLAADRSDVLTRLALAQPQRSQGGSAQRPSNPEGGRVFNPPPQQPDVGPDASPRVPREEERKQEEPDSAGGFMDMLSKGVGLFFGRQSDVKSPADGRASNGSPWPPPPRRYQEKDEHPFARADSDPPQEIHMECAKCGQ